MRSNIDGVVIKEIKKFTDDRGWLCEIFRKDELAEDIFPAMSYVSMTKPGVARGPHEHVRQIDLFCFLGTSEFSLMLWDNRKKSECYHEKEIIVCLQGTAVIVEKICYNHDLQNQDNDQTGETAWFIWYDCFSTNFYR